MLLSMVPTPFGSLITRRMELVYGVSVIELYAMKELPELTLSVEEA